MIRSIRVQDKDTPFNLKRKVFPTKYNVKSVNTGLNPVKKRAIPLFSSFHRLMISKNRYQTY